MKREWQVLDVGSIWMKEFASALSQTEEVVAWAPQIKGFSLLHPWEQVTTLADPPLRILQFPLQRGYARALIRSAVPFQHRLVREMLSKVKHPASSALICSTPFYAPVAELWPGPVIYYVTDLTIAYESVKAAQVLALDLRMCRVAAAVCPNSKRIASYLVEQAGCDSAKITIVPNATRAGNVSEAPLLQPTALPSDASDLPRPVVGVIGDLSGNLDWKLIAEAVQRTPWASWLFVGPSDRHIADQTESAAREWVKAHARFVGMRPYGELQQYARGLDAAVLPYRRREPTFSGSSTRFYEHLAACRPMLATRGFAELLENEPLVTLVDTSAEMAAALEKLRAIAFHDGHETMRWSASRKGTWEERAQTIRNVLNS